MPGSAPVSLGVGYAALTWPMLATSSGTAHPALTSGRRCTWDLAAQGGAPRQPTREPLIGHVSGAYQTTPNAPRPPSERGRPMRTERFTTRTQEAILAAQQLAEGEGHPELTAAHLLLSLIDQPDGVVPAVLEKAGKDPAAIAEALRGRLAHLPRVSGEGAQLSLSNEAPQCPDRGPCHRRAAARRVRLDRAPAAGHRGGGIRQRRGQGPGRAWGRQRDHHGGPLQHPREPARDQREPRSHLPGPGEVRPRPDRCRPPRAARSGDRPRRGDPPRHPGAQPAHQEQPGADRRARRRQDGHRRRAGPAASCAATCPRACATSAWWRWTWARWWPAPSTAASSRSA